VTQELTFFTSFYIFSIVKKRVGKKPLAASLRHFTTVKDSENPLLPAFDIFTTLKDSENPCCQPTPFYTVYCPFNPLAAILYGFTLVCGLQAKRSSGKREERETLAAILYGFMPFYIP
jgi:hypothetical protein